MSSEKGKIMERFKELLEKRWRDLEIILARCTVLERQLLMVVWFEYQRIIQI